MLHNIMKSGSQNEVHLYIFIRGGGGGGGGGYFQRHQQNTSVICRTPERVPGRFRTIVKHVFLTLVCDTLVHFQSYHQNG